LTLALLRLALALAADLAFSHGGTGLLLWAQALKQLGWDTEADATLRLVSQRDPESEAATVAAELLAAAT
jgi:hypothetical protein